MAYKGTIQFSSNKFAKSFKQGLIGPKIEKKGSSEYIDNFKKYLKKRDNKKHIKTGKHKFKQGDFVEVMSKYRSKVDDEYENKYYVTDYDVDPAIKEKSNTAKGKHFLSTIPYKKVKGKIAMVAMPMVAMPIYSDEGNLRLKKLGKREIKKDKEAQNLLKNIKKTKKKGGRKSTRKKRTRRRKKRTHRRKKLTRRRRRKKR